MSQTILSQIIEEIRNFHYRNQKKFSLISVVYSNCPMTLPPVEPPGPGARPITWSSFIARHLFTDSGVAIGLAENRGYCIFDKQNLAGF